MTGQDRLFPKNPILIIDDEPSWLKSMALSLRLFADITNVVLCQDSRDAVNLLAEKSFSLVLLDLTMPHLSGELLLKSFSEKYPELPVIVVSGMNQIETAIECIKSGAVDFFCQNGRSAAGYQRHSQCHQAGGAKDVKISVWQKACSLIARPHTLPLQLS